MERIGRSGAAQDVRRDRPEQVAPPGRPRRRRSVTLRVRVDIEGLEPPIWRRLDLASDLTLDRVHAVLQTAFGWQNSHLHSFSTRSDRGENSTQRSLPELDVAQGDDGIVESEVQLDELLVAAGDRLSYTYDFGADWQHTVLLESVGPRTPGDRVAGLVAGRGAGPPEDCGGVWGYQDLLHRGAAAGDPEFLDLAGINAELALGRTPGKG